jgi:hypothetical protein
MSGDGDRHHRQETPEELEANGELKQRLEAIRLKAGPMMNLGDVAEKSVPKMTMVSRPPARAARSIHAHLHSASLPQGHRRARRRQRRDGLPDRRSRRSSMKPARN